MCMRVSVNGEEVDCPSDLQKHVGILYSHKSYMGGVTGIVFDNYETGSCLCQIDVPLSAERAGYEVKNGWSEPESVDLVLTRVPSGGAASSV